MPENESEVQIEMDLVDTVESMLSSDYKLRFKAEYNQLEIRIKKLEQMLKSWKEGTLGFEPKCSYELLECQLSAMKNYLGFLKQRSKIEEIEL